MGKRYPRITWEHLEKFNKDVFALTACSNGLVGKTLITDDDEEKAVCHMKRFHSIFQDRFFLEIQPHDLKTEDGKIDQMRLNLSLVKYARDYGMNYVVTCDAHYLDKEHAQYHDLMLAIKDKKSWDDPDRFRYGTQEMYLKSPDEIREFFGDEIAEKAMANSLLIADACEVPEYLEPRGPMLPKFPVADEPDYSEFKDWHQEACPDVEEDKAYLRYKCVESFKKKSKDFKVEDKKLYWDRVKKELQVLEARDFSSYILIVADYINWAKRNKIAV
jgi:DNA polymerase-3 subunit alpha